MPKMAPLLCTTQPKFDNKFKTVIERKYNDSSWEMVDWVNNNSKGDVDVKFITSENNSLVYFAFENADDALYFGIKF